MSLLEDLVKFSIEKNRILEFYIYRLYLNDNQNYLLKMSIYNDTDDDDSKINKDIYTLRNIINDYGIVRSEDQSSLESFINDEEYDSYDFNFIYENKSITEMIETETNRDVYIHNFFIEQINKLKKLYDIEITTPYVVKMRKIVIRP